MRNENNVLSLSSYLTTSEMATLQKLTKRSDDNIALAQRYYSIISVLNDLKLTERETQLVAFSAVKGNLSNANVREEFKNIYNTSFPTINNIISRLRKIGVFVKEGKKIKVNPAIALDFKKDVVLEIKLLHNG